MTRRIRLFWLGVLTTAVVATSAALLAPPAAVQGLPIDRHGHTICPPGNSNRGGTGPGHSHNGQCLVTPTAVPTRVPHPHH